MGVRQAALQSFANQQVESWTELTDNSITTGNSWSDPKPRKFGGLTETEGRSLRGLRRRRRTAFLQVLCRFLFGQSLLAGVCRHDSHCYGYPVRSRTAGHLLSRHPLTEDGHLLPGHGGAHPYPRYSYQPPHPFLSSVRCSTSMNIYPPFR